MGNKSCIRARRARKLPQHNGSFCHSDGRLGGSWLTVPSQRGDTLLAVVLTCRSSKHIILMSVKILSLTRANPFCNAKDSPSASTSDRVDHPCACVHYARACMLQRFDSQTWCGLCNIVLLHRDESRVCLQDMYWRDSGTVGLNHAQQVTSQTCHLRNYDNWPR
jgi:hypothetical protein